MEKFDFARFVGGVRSLKRELAQGIIDKSELFSHNQTHADAEQEALRTKMKERNLRYVAQRRKKLENLQIDTSYSTSQIMKSSELASPSEHPYHKSSFQSNRSSLTSPKMVPLSPKRDSFSKKSKYVPNATNSSIETNDLTLYTSVPTKENFRLPSAKKPAIDLTKAARLPLPNMIEIRENNLPIPSIGSGMLSPSASNFRSTRRGELPFRKTIVKDFVRKNSSFNGISRNKFPTAKRILDAVLSITNDLTFQIQRSQSYSEELFNQTKNQLIEYYKNMVEMLGAAHDALVTAIEVSKDKPVLDKYLNEVIKCAQKSRNTEFNIAALKLQAKILMKHKDFYKSIGNFKAIKRTADSNIDFSSQNMKVNRNFLLHKLSCYKNIGKCFQDIQNYKQSMFYFVKMLQTAWLLKDLDSELLAYDFIGIQYYYQGEIDKANYYHHKLLLGEVEKVVSDLRELGIQKMKQNIQDKSHKAQKFRFDTIKSIEEELTSSNPPESEDEFELNDTAKMRLKLDISRTEKPLRNSTARLKLLPLVLEQKKLENKRKYRNEVGRQAVHKSMNITTMFFEARSLSLKQAIYLSHLSPNKNVQNFNNADAKEVVNTFVNIDSIYGNGPRSITLDKLSLEKVRRILEKLRDNLLLAKTEVERMAEAATAELDKILSVNSRTRFSETSLNSPKDALKRIIKM